MKAEIITIGDELLIGHTTDTNSAWIAKHLNQVGIAVRQITSVSDNEQHIITALREAGKHVDVVIITGGLGPTKDDITKNTLTKFMEDELIFDEKVFNHIRNLYESKGREIGEHNKQQAMVPSKCEVLYNRHGTAPGMWFDTGDLIVVSMPGVPYEMISMMEYDVLDRLALRSNGYEVVHRYVITQGIPESAIMMLIESWELALPAPLKLAYLPSAGMVKLRISAKVKGERLSLEQVMAAELEKLEKYISRYIVGYDDDSLELVVGKLLKQQGKTIATAESCTGGYIAHLVTSVAGSSDYFLGSVVAYQNEVKEKMLHVDSELLEKHGAVSQEVVEAMTRGVLEETGADMAIATSGIAGPTGGSEEKPVGTVWIAVGSADHIVAKKFRFGKHRNTNIEFTAVTALNMLRKELLHTLAN